MKGKTIALFETTIRQDENGRYCLNDLHKAAMANSQATESQRPANFLKSSGINAFIGVIDENATNVAIIVY